MESKKENKTHPWRMCGLMQITNDTRKILGYEKGDHKAIFNGFLEVLKNVETNYLRSAFNLLHCKHSK